MILNTRLSGGVAEVESLTWIESACDLLTGFCDKTLINAFRQQLHVIILDHCR